MILRIFLLACAIASPTFGLMNLGTFSSKFAQQCFQNNPTEPFKINGQEMTLSNTLENFIALAEKLEAANPSIELKKELVYFITEYLFENIEFVSGQPVVFTIRRGKFEKILSLWDPDRREEKPNLIDPFTDDEKCSLYYMISHSLLGKDIQLLRSYSPSNSSSNFGRDYKADLNPDEYHPQELGVVAIRGTNIAISLSKVLIGLYVGLFDHRMTDLNDESIRNEDINEPKLTTNAIDALYAVTLVEVLMQSQWASERPGLAYDGIWKSIEISSDKSIESFCPMVYKHEISLDNKYPLHSYSSIRGAADGLILGLSIPIVNKKKRNSKLSQLLRMYYSSDGIPLETPIEETDVKRVTFCDRQNLMSAVDHRLKDQMLAYGYVTAVTWDEVESFSQKAEDIYKNAKESILGIPYGEIQNYCARSHSIEKPEELPRETFLDVLVVMDSSKSEDSFLEQQMIVGNLAKQLDLRYTASRMTILLDQKIISERGTTSRIELKPVVFDTYSSSCAACMVGQIPYEHSTVERDEIIVAIDQFLEERKENETNHGGVNGKVVVYFNYESSEGRNGINGNRFQGRLEKALRNFHLNHQDIIFYAVGLDPEILKKYAKNDPALVFLGTGESYEQVAKKIYEKISLAPALLQYSDCSKAENERAAIYENFVSPHKVQHYEMPAEYFYKSRSITVNFESQNGYINVCHNRATMRPENESRFCKNTTGTTSAEFKISNPCKNFRKETCSPFYFSIMGMDTSPDMRPDPRPRNYCDDINDHWCSSLDQIKYKVSHTGIRCSGCLGLAAPPAVILFTILLAYFVHKLF